MIHDHGQIHISLHKPIQFQMRMNAVLMNESPFFDAFGIKNVHVKTEVKKDWLGWRILDKQLQVVGLKVGSHKVQWYYDDRCCSAFFADTHQVTFVVDSEVNSGESILVNTNNGSQFYRGFLPLSDSSESREYDYRSDYVNYAYPQQQGQTQNARYRGQGPGPSKEFKFFDEAFRLLDKMMYQGGGRNGSFRELFVHLARNSTTGRIPWGDLLGFFPSDWEPSYYHAVERIVQLMRQASDIGHIKHGELRILISLANEIVKDRELQLTSYSCLSNPGEFDMKNLVGFWKSVVGRLKTISISPEESIDDLALSFCF